VVFSMVHTSWIECRNSVARLAGDARKALLFGEKLSDLQAHHKLTREKLLERLFPASFSV
jgi:hypothetical protein